MEAVPLVGVMRTPVGSRLALSLLSPCLSPAGAEEPLYDQLTVSGQVKIQGGVLTISTSNGFKPAVGDSFRILNVGRVEGRFESIVLPPLEAGERWSLNDLYATGTIRVMKE